MQMKIIIVVGILIFLTNCTNSPITLVEPVETVDTEYVVGERWMDYDDLIKLAEFSSGKDELNINEVKSFIGEPIYLEIVYNGDYYLTLLWYKYKSKYFPLSETKITQKIQPPSLRKFKSDTIKRETIISKPPKDGNFNMWNGTSKWLLVVVSDNYHEILLTDIDSTETPNYKREYLLEKLKLENKN
jgi:hypothetical protein